MLVDGWIDNEEYWVGEREREREGEKGAVKVERKRVKGQNQREERKIVRECNPDI